MYGVSPFRTGLIRTLDKVVAWSCVCFAALEAWAAVGRGGMGLPLVAQAAMAVSLLILLLGHMWKHLGVRLMLAFFVTSAVLEWAFEQSNISFGGFIWGDIRYGDMGIFSVHLGDVPIAVPVMMAAILWPTYAMVNLALDGRVVIEPRSITWWQGIWRCVLYGMVHSWLMLVFNGVCEQWVHDTGEPNRWQHRTMDDGVLRGVRRLPVRSNHAGTTAVPRCEGVRRN
jgi:hypothetical protein